MVSALLNLWFSFLAGLYAPIGAVCVLPLYPGFLAYLSNQLQGKADRKTLILLGFVVTGGVVLSMLLFGLLFVFFLQESLTNAIGIVSPIAFGVLALISILLIFNVDIGKLFPQLHAPALKNPILSSFIFGFFFGFIVLPCNPASLAVLFTLSTSTTAAITNFLNFVLFGLGMALPLLLFSIISSAKSQEVIGWLTKRKRMINLIAGVIMLGIALYYLFFVFRVLG